MLLAALSAALLCAAPAPAAAQTPLTIRFAGEEWPPFVTPSLPDDGLSGALMRATFERLGYAVRIDYFPWKRAMELGLHDPRYAGLLAVWRTPEREKQCHFSVPVGNTLTVIASLKDKPVAASRVDDLRGIRIGIVGGYSNGDEFDALVRQHQLDVEEGVNDETNLRKLLARRFPALVIERRVLRHLLATRFTAADRERIAVNDRVFRERPVHLCFRRSPEGQLQQRAFNDAARTLDFNQLEKDYWRRIGQQTGN